MRRRGVHQHLAAGIVAAALVASAGALPARAAGGVPNDPLYPRQWGLAVVGAPAAWAMSTGKGVVIGIVDTGVDLTHQDLGSHVLASTDCIGSNGDPSLCHGSGQDDEGHGTHVAGIANAVTDNGVGVAGMAPDARLVVAKAVDSNGSGSVADIAAGIEWVVSKGARVVNLSLGDPNTLFTSAFGSTLAPAIEFAWSKGAIPVLASGNSNFLGLGSANYGNLDAVIVGAVAHNGALASYSSPTGNAKWAVLAPGGSADGVQADDILSTYWVSGQTNQYGYLAGTSMATPFVSGTLALLLAAGLTPIQAVSRLLSTVDTAVSCGGGSNNCRGMINAAAALTGLGAVPPPPTTAAPPTSAPTSVVAPTSLEPPSTSASPPAGPGVTVPAAAPAPASAARPPSSVIAAPPAVMVPRTGHAAEPASPTSSVATQARSTTAAPGRVAVGLADTSHRHHASGSLVWFALLAGVFVLLVAAGIVKVMGSTPSS